MQLTPKQLEATDAIMEFFLNDEPYMVLSGYAGVGKSTVINHVTTEYVKSTSQVVKMVSKAFHNYSILVTATTNKAVDVLQNMMPHLDCTTIHVALSLRVKGKGLTKTKVNSEPAIYIVDEASMISTELLGFIEDAVTRNKAKFLFIGDPTQLPPVGEDFSPVFHMGYPTVEMTEMLRQPEGPLRELADGLRRQVLGEPLETIEVDDKEIIWLDRDSFKKAILDDMLDPNWYDSRSKAISYTNKMAIAMNRLVKTKLTGTHKLQSGDYAINNKSLFSNTIRLKTDALVYIRHVQHDIEDHGVMGCEVQIDNFTQTLFVPYDINMKAVMENKALAQRDYDKINYFESNWADLRSSYACTVHKSQGSTYETAYVDIQDIAKAGNFNLNLMHRLLYVAVSRASKRVVFTGEIPEYLL